MYRKYMMEAVKEAERAAKMGEVPIGAVIVQEFPMQARLSLEQQPDGSIKKIGRAHV